MPTLRQLQYFAALGECRNYRKAAELTGVSQPTLSAQLAALEERLGCDLVEHGRSPVILTAAGEELLPMVQKVLAKVQKIRDRAAKHHRRAGGVVRLGLPASIGPYLLPHVVASLHRAYPHLRLYVREGIPEALPDGLVRGIHDLLITPIPVRGEGLSCQALFREPLFLAVPAGHSFINRSDVTLKDLADQSILTLEKGHALHEQVAALCQDCGAKLLDDYEGTSLDTLRQMTGMGLGLTFLPGLYVKSTMGADESVAIVNIKGRDLNRTIGVAWRQGSPGEETYRRIASHVRDAVRHKFPGFQTFED
jgi:LysR family hydrogen peroxide-inducible transcriptional activator